MLNNLDKEDRNIIILIIIFLLILSIYIICRLLKEDKVRDNIEVFNDYSLIGETNRFKLYSIDSDILSNFNTYINDVNIKYNNEVLEINSTRIIDHITLLSNVAFYEDNIVLLAKSNQFYTDVIIMYNKYSGEYHVINKIDDMYIIDLDTAEMSEAGIHVHLTNIIDNNIYIDDKITDICDYSTDVEVFKDVMYYYDFDSMNYYSLEVYNSYRLSDYTKGIC